MVTTILFYRRGVQAQRGDVSAQSLIGNEWLGHDLIFRSVAPVPVLSWPLPTTLPPSLQQKNRPVLVTVTPVSIVYWPSTQTGSKAYATECPKESSQTCPVWVLSPAFVPRTLVEGRKLTGNPGTASLSPHFMTTCPPSVWGPRKRWRCFVPAFSAV